MYRIFGLTPAAMCCFWLILTPSFAATPEDSERDLPALMKAVSEHPRLKIQEAAVDAAKAKLDRIQSARSPRVSLVLDGDVPAGNDQQTVLGITAETTLIDWGLNEAQIDEANSRLSSQQERGVQTIHDLEQQVIDHFVRAHRAAAQKRAVDFSIENVSEFRAIIARRVAQNVNPQSDLLAIDGRNAQFETLRLQLLGEIRSSQLALLELTGAKANLDRREECVGVLDEAVAIKEALDQSPQLRVARRDAEAVLKQQAVLDAGRLPAIVAGVELAQDVTAIEDRSRAYVGLSYQFDAGGRFDAEDAELRAQYMDLIFRERALSQEIVRDVSELVNQLQVGRSQVAVFDTMVRVRESQLDALMRRFTAGQSSLFDVTGTQKELHDARLALEDAHYLACRSWYQLQQRTGRRISNE